ncbi:MAG: thiolase family protein [Deltaproteobacteria bacterium]|nr:thiolase family protein [Deltaproteobacteria bacterium]
MQDVYIIGVDTIRFGKYIDKSIKDLAAMTVTGCLKEANLTKEAIQAVWFSNAGWGEKGQTTIRGQVALKPMGIDGIPITNVENACAGGSTALHHAWLGVASGLYEITLAVGAEKLYHSNKLAVMMGFLGGIDVENVLDIIKNLSVFELTQADREAMERFKKLYQAPQANQKKKSKDKESLWKKFRDRFTVAIMMGERIGYDTMWQLAKLGSGDHSPFMDVYGYAARQHMKRYGSTVEQLAIIASKNHFNSTLNPNAQYQFEVPVEKVLADRIVSWPLTRAMCAPIGDGAASAILCSEEIVKKLGLVSQAVRIRASILGSGKKTSFDSNEPEIGERLSKLAYEKAGVCPQDINIAEVHDATAFGEVVQAENLGFCPRGEGGIFAEKGETSLKGRIPINTSGGLTSRGHPIGASGLAQVHELVTQLRGNAGKRQVKKAKLAMAENGGGALGTEEAAMGIHILEAPSR